MASIFHTTWLSGRDRRNALISWRQPPWWVASYSFFFFSLSSSDGGERNRFGNQFTSGKALLARLSLLSDLPANRAVTKLFRRAAVLAGFSSTGGSAGGVRGCSGMAVAIMGVSPVLAGGVGSASGPGGATAGLGFEFNEAKDCLISASSAHSCQRGTRQVPRTDLHAH